MPAAKGSDEVWLGVKRQSNLVIAGSLRNSFRASLPCSLEGVELLEGMGARKGTPFYQTPNTSRLSGGVSVWELSSRGERETSLPVG